MKINIMRVIVEKIINYLFYHNNIFIFYLNENHLKLRNNL